MTRKDQVFVINVVVIDLTWEIMALNVITILAGAAANLAPLLRFANIEGFMKGTILF